MKSAAALARHVDHFGVRLVALRARCSRETIARYVARLPLLPKSLGKIAAYLTKMN